MPGPLRYLLVLSRADPVATAVGERLPMGEAIGTVPDGGTVRHIGEGVGRLDRAGRPFEDEGLDALLPIDLRGAELPIVFVSRHRSERGVECFTTHPIGNPGPARFGGMPGHLVPSAPRWMAAALRRLAEAGAGLGLPATYEATHHGPALEAPAMFVEFGAGEGADPPPPGVAARLAQVVRDLVPEEGDTVAVGIGGGHYAPHFTDLALRRRWAFGHILSRHALAGATAALGREALARTPGAAGFLFHRAADAREPPGSDLIPRLAEGGVARRDAPAGGVDGAVTSSARAYDRAAGT